MRNPASSVRSIPHNVTSTGIYTTVQALATTIAIVAGAVWALNLGDGRDRPVRFPPTGAEALGAIQREKTEQGDVPVESPAQDTVFIVGSEAEAQSLRVLLAEFATIRSAMGLVPVRDEVVIAASSEEAHRLKDALQEGNRILAGQGEPEVRIVNLVGNSVAQGTTLPPDPLNYRP